MGKRLYTYNKWFKTLEREFRYRKIMFERGWILDVRNSRYPLYIAGLYRSEYSYEFKRV